MVAPTRHHFQSADTTQTLAQGLAEYFDAHPGLKRDSDLLSPVAKQFFRSHDAVHVLYGCGTSMSDEAIVKLSSLFGTTGGRAVLRGYVHHETLDIYRQLPVASTIVAIVSAPYLIACTLWRCSRQRQRWPWVDYDQYVHVPLRQLRADFGIKVAHRRSDA